MAENTENTAKKEELKPVKPLTLKDVRGKISAKENKIFALLKEIAELKEKENGLEDADAAVEKKADYYRNLVDKNETRYANLIHASNALKSAAKDANAEIYEIKERMAYAEHNELRDFIVAEYVRHKKMTNDEIKAALAKGAEIFGEIRNLPTETEEEFPVETGVPAQEESLENRSQNMVTSVENMETPAGNAPAEIADKSEW
jgi:hypothetical protein